MARRGIPTQHGSSRRVCIASATWRGSSALGQTLRSQQNPKRSLSAVDPIATTLSKRRKRRRQAASATVSLYRSPLAIIAHAILAISIGIYAVLQVTGLTPAEHSAGR
jgi:hypothetical protein